MWYREVRKKVKKMNRINEYDVYMFSWYEVDGYFYTFLLGTKFVVLSGLGALVGNDVPRRDFFPKNINKSITL
jgi:hypothetical protein